MSFQACVDIIIELEGGATLTDDPKDPGGRTKYGLSARAFPMVDIPGLDLETAQGLYLTHYWRPLKCDHLPAKIALCVFDCAVNQGQGVAARLLQLATGAKPDGMVGKETIRFANLQDQDFLISDFMARRAHRYVLSEGYSEFGRGWMRRLFVVTMRAQKL